MRPELSKSLGCCGPMEWETRMKRFALHYFRWYARLLKGSVHSVLLFLWSRLPYLATQWVRESRTRAYSPLRLVNHGYTAGQGHPNGYHGNKHLGWVCLAGPDRSREPSSYTHANPFWRRDGNDQLFVVRIRRKWYYFADAYVLCSWVNSIIMKIWGEI